MSNHEPSAYTSQVTRRTMLQMTVAGALSAGLRPSPSFGEPYMTRPTPAIPADATFDGTWPFPARYTDAPGYAAHYVDVGKGPETLLLLHGEPTWSYLFRHQIATWSRHHRVVAVDHMGFGKSATPSDRNYWLQDHIDNLEAVALALDLRDVTLVMHDFGGPTGMGFAIRHPDRVKRIVSVNGPTPFGQADLIDRLVANGGEAPWFQWILKAHDNGTLEPLLGQLDYTILSTLKLNGFEDASIVTEAWLNAYRAPFPTPAEAAGAIGWAKGFATGAHRFEEPDAATRQAISAKPALALWGEEDQTLHAKHFLPLFKTAFPNGRIQRLPGAGHYSPEDAPREVTDHVLSFIG